MLSSYNIFLINLQTNKIHINSFILISIYPYKNNNNNNKKRKQNYYVIYFGENIDFYTEMKKKKIK